MLAVLSNINIEPLKMFFKNEKSYFAPYNQIRQEFLNNNSFIHSNDIHRIFIFLDYSENLVGASLDEKSLDLIQQDYLFIMDLIEEYAKKNTNVLIIINNQFMENNYLVPYYKHYMLRFYNLEKNMNDKLLKLSIENKNIYILDWQKLVKIYGFEKLVNKKYWYIGRIPLTTFAFEIIYKEYCNILKAIQGITKKVCIVDLDNTLWGGVVGDDGIDGILLSEEGMGKAYRDFQKCIKSLKDLGILLAIVSKNNYDVVKECFNNHPMMLLSLDDFVVLKINWNNKADNIKEIANQLNLGLDSFVFIDDNPFERNLVKEFLPEVNVPEFPADPYMLVDWFYHHIIPIYFPKSVITDEDLEKNEQYKANVKRSELEKEVKDYNKYIAELDIKIKIYKNNINQISRISQLTQKTNQFNLTTKRYTELDIENIMKEQNGYIYSFEYIDKFGKEGIVGVVIILKNDDKYYIDTFLLSCRVFGRFVEFNFLKKICIDLRDSGIKELYSHYIPTQKNIIVKDFYANCGFDTLDEGCFCGKIDDIIEYISKNYIDINAEVVINE